jgi:hypothetical protein
MEPVEYHEWYAQMADDAPGQVTVERSVYRKVLDLLDFEYADHPQRQVAQYQERYKGAARLEPCVDWIIGRTMKSVENEYGLSGGLFESIEAVDI